MPSPDAVGMIPLEDLAYPITFRFHLSTAWGFTYQEMTLDIPELQDDLAAIDRFCHALWSVFIATAITASVELFLAEALQWKKGGLPLLMPTSFGNGKIHGTPADMKESGVIVLHTAGVDNNSRRRFYLPGMPKIWQDNRRLSQTGITQLYNWTSVFTMAFLAPELPRPFDWLIAYPRVFDFKPSNVWGVGFRYVERCRVCWHTSKPPEGAGTNYP